MYPARVSPGSILYVTSSKGGSLASHWISSPAGCSTRRHIQYDHSIAQELSDVEGNNLLDELCYSEECPAEQCATLRRCEAAAEKLYDDALQSSNSFENCPCGRPDTRIFVLKQWRDEQYVYPMAVSG